MITSAIICTHFMQHSKSYVVKTEIEINFVEVSPLFVQSSVWMGRHTGQDEETERRRKRDGDGDERGRAGTAHYAQDGMSIMSLCVLPNPI